MREHRLKLEASPRITVSQNRTATSGVRHGHACKGEVDLQRFLRPRPHPQEWASLFPQPPLTSTPSCSSLYSILDLGLLLWGQHGLRGLGISCYRCAFQSVCCCRSRLSTWSALPPNWSLALTSRPSIDSLLGPSNTQPGVHTGCVFYQQGSSPVVP